MPLAPMEEVVAALRDGRVVIVADDEARENEGDAIVSADARHAGVDRLDREPHLRLHLRPDDERDRRSARPADDGPGEPGPARHRVHGQRRRDGPPRDGDQRRRPRPHAERARRPRLDGRRCSAGPATSCRSARSTAASGERGGHTEASVDLMKLAGLPPVAAISEIVSPDGSMTRLPGLLELGEREGVPVTTVAALVRLPRRAPPRAASAGDHRAAPAARVRFEVETHLRTSHGVFRTRAYRDLLTGDEHVALVVDGDGSRPPLVRVHSECLTGRGVRLRPVRVRAAARRRARPGAGARAAPSSTCAGRRGAASGSSTSCGRTACRRTGSTPSTRTSRSGSPWTRGSTAPPPRSWPTWASTGSGC